MTMKLAPIDGCGEVGVIRRETTAALCFRFDTEEQADAFARMLTEAVASGKFTFEMQRDEYRAHELH